MIRRQVSPTYPPTERGRTWAEEDMRRTRRADDCVHEIASPWDDWTVERTPDVGNGGGWGVFVTYSVSARTHARERVT